MKKKLSLLGITLLCSSVLSTTPVLDAIVYADGAEETTETSTVTTGTPTEASTEASESATETSEGTTETSTSEAPETSESTGTSEVPGTSESTDTSEAPGTSESIEAPGETIEVVRSQLQALIDEATTYLNYDKYNNEILFYLENYIINAKAVVADPNATIEDMQDYIDVLTTALNYVKDSANDRDPNTKVSLEVANQTMHVGDVITPEMVLGWATVTNGDNLYLEAEVIGAPIMINSITNQLVEAGTFTIRYTLKSVDSENNPLAATSRGINPQMTVTSKDITLTVLPNGVVEPVEPAKPLEPTAPVVDPVSPTPTIIPTTAKAKATDPDKNLPQTGEKDSSMLVALGGMTLLAGAFVFNKKRLEDQ